MTTNLGHLELFCTDPAATAAFYCEHFGFEQDEIQGEQFYWIRSGDRMLLLRPAETPRVASPTYGDSRIGLVLYTDDLPQLLERLVAAGIDVVADADGPGCSAIRDPEGNWIQVVDPAGH